MDKENLSRLVLKIDMKTLGVKGSPILIDSDNIALSKDGFSVLIKEKNKTTISITEVRICEIKRPATPILRYKTKNKDIKKIRVLFNIL